MLLFAFFRFLLHHLLGQVFEESADAFAPVYALMVREGVSAFVGLAYKQKIQGGVVPDDISIGDDDFINAIWAFYLKIFGRCTGEGIGPEPGFAKIRPPAF